jgi:hypothetical protein
MTQTRGGIARLLAAAAAFASLAMATSAEARAPLRPARTLTWPQLLQRSDAVALVEIGRPVAKQTKLPVGVGSDFVRHQRHMTVVALAKEPALRGRGLRVGQQILVDDVDWRGDMQDHQRCQELKKAKGQGELCPALADKDGLASQLSREPASGQQVVVALKKVNGDWQLAAERAMDTAQNWPMLQGLMRSRR